VSDYLGLIFSCVWESASLMKTRQGVSRQERQVLFLSAGPETGIYIFSSGDVIHFADCT
jgi:hypothetical protein